MKKRLLALCLVLCMVLGMLPMTAFAEAGETAVTLTVDSLGLPSDAYTASTATVDGVGFEWIQLGNYGDGIQMRDRKGNTSILWNATAFPGKITKIELTYSSTQSVTYSNPDSVLYCF